LIWNLSWLPKLPQLYAHVPHHFLLKSKNGRGFGFPLFKSLQNLIISYPGLAYNKCASDSHSKTVLILVSLGSILFARLTVLRYMRERDCPFYDDLCDAIMSAAYSFPPPRGTLPAEQRPDDMDRIMDRHTCFDNPMMLHFISSLGDSQRNFMNTTLEIVRKCFPAFPPSFRIWDTKPGHNLTVRSTCTCAIS
jgi:hypothetical protein